MRGTKAGETRHEAGHGSRIGNHSRTKLDFIPDKPVFTSIKHRQISGAEEHVIVRWY